MKKSTIISKKIIRNIKRSIIESDFKLDIDLLMTEKYFNYQIQDWYGEEFGIKGELRRIIINTLIELFFEWKEKLDTLNKDYYLAIWLFDPRMLRSEVVCAIDEEIHYYENEAFIDSEKSIEAISDRFKPCNNELSVLNWTRKVDLDPTYEWEMNIPKEQHINEKAYFFNQRFYKKIKKNAYQIIENGEGKVYFTKKGDIWIGKLKT